MHFAFSSLFRNLRKFRVISKNKMKLSNLKTYLLLELKIAPFFIFVLSFYFRFISPRLCKRIFSRKHQLRILDCTQCDWVTDDSIHIVAENCPFMESLTLAKCRNRQIDRQIDRQIALLKIHCSPRAGLRTVQYVEY